ncbi:MAG: malonyl-CoA synthase [Pseudomonadota bacterium]
MNAPSPEPSPEPSQKPTPTSNFYAELQAAWQDRRAATAFECMDGTTRSYGDLEAGVDRMAAALRRLGVAPGDRITVQVEKSIAAVELYLATLKVGAIFNPLNTAYTPAELDYFLCDAAPTLLVTTGKTREALAPIAARHGVRHVETLDGDAPDNSFGRGSLAERAAATSPDAATAAGVETAAVAQDDLACLLYTSGTTGRSKGAMITHRNLASNARTLHQTWHFSPDDVTLHALPIYHVHGLFVCLHTALLNASPMLWLEKFDLDAVVERLPRTTVMMGVPTFYTRLLADNRLDHDRVASMRLFVAGSAPLLAETHTAFEQRTGHHILERYGMTEAGMITSNPYAPQGRLPGSVGFPLDGVDVRIADDAGNALPHGEIGTLEVRGPNVCIGYWRKADKTAEEFRADGFFITGDLARQDPDGRIAIVGRAKDLIISGGFNVYPKEIETAIDDIDGVEESAVVGVPHPDFGEGVIAVVVPKADAELSADKIRAALADQLAKFKQPKRILVEDELPRNTMGKVQKAALRERLKDTFTG